MKNKNKFKFFLSYYLPIGLWLAVIFAMSSMRGNPHNGQISFWFYVERKGAHITEYFILTLLLLRLFWRRGIEKCLIIFYAVSLSVLWATSDEIHQLFVYGREGKISDVGIDCIGIFLAIMTFLIFEKKYYFGKYVLNQKRGNR